MQLFLPHLQGLDCGFQINTPLRWAAFIAQAAHESNEFQALEENLNYSALGLIATWPKRFDQAKAQQYARQPQKIANYVYANRMGNGDEASGDGFAHRGRGLFQITGKDGYKLHGGLLGVNLLTDPSIVATPEWAVKTAASYWKYKTLNVLADARDFDAITHKINGGSIGQVERNKYYKLAKLALGVSP